MDRPGCRKVTYAVVWYGSADVTGSDPDYAILVDSDKSLTATFSAL